MLEALGECYCAARSSSMVINVKFDSITRSIKIKLKDMRWNIKATSRAEFCAALLDAPPPTPLSCECIYVSALIEYKMRII